MKIVIDHVAGSRRGQRQELSAPERVRFGRHPENEVTFDAHRDLDASSRHAELRREGERYRLCDIGSSNGTYVAGEPITEIDIDTGETLEVEFGSGGPRVRIFVGAEVDEPPAPPELGRGLAARGWLLVAVAAVVAAVVAVAIALR